MSNNKQGNLNIPEIRFPEFDEHWKEVNLKSIATFSKGKGISKSDISENGIPCIRYGELYTKYNENITDIYSKTNLEKSNLVMSENNDILIPCSGETAIDLATASCVREKNVAIGGDITIIKTNQYAPFIAYCINNKRTEIAKYAQGVSIVHLYYKDFQEMKLKIPDLSEQEKIVTFLSVIDKKIELMENKINAYKKKKKTLIETIFFNRDVLKNHEEDYEYISLGKICEVFGRIGFRGYTVEDLVEKNEGALTIGGKHINKNFRLNLKEPEYLSWEKYEESPEIKVKNEDILFVKTASVGKLCIIENLNYPATINPQLIVLKNIKINNKYLYYYMISNIFQKELTKIKTTTGIPTITQKEFLKIKIHVPTTKKQEEIAYVLSAIDKKESMLLDDLESIKDFKKGLIQKMFV